MVKVLQICQWRFAADKGNLFNYSLEDLDHVEQDYYFQIKEVNPESNPPLAKFWLKENEETGKLEVFKSNIDSSD